MNFWLALALTLLIYAIPVAVVLKRRGVFGWLAMTASFARHELHPERRRLLTLRIKLVVLRNLARSIGRTEARVAEAEREI